MVNGTDGVQKLYPDATTHPKYFIYPDGHWEGESASDAGGGFFKFGSSGQIRFTIIPNGSTGCSKGISDHAKALSQGFMCSADDWRNFEATWYVKHGSGSDQYTIYGRGGTHSDSCPCCGFAYKARFWTDGSVDIAIETWHVHYQFFNKQGGKIPSLGGKVVGLKFACYDTPGNANSVTNELWCDPSNNNTWSKVMTFVDSGSSDAGDHCGTKKNQVGLWGGPELTFRTDGLSYSWQKMSGREINATGGFTDGGGTPPSGTPPPPGGGPPPPPEEIPILDGYFIIDVTTGQI